MTFRAAAPRAVVPAAAARRTCVLAVAALLLAGCGGSPGPAAAPSLRTSETQPATPTGTPGSRPAASEPTVVAQGLEIPWGLTFLPGGDALVSERETARVLRIPAAGGEPVQVTTLAQAAPRGEGGLLGLAVDPQDPAQAYAYVTTQDDNRVVRFAADGSGPPRPVLTGIPAGTIHNGGRITFGPDGALYVGTGDTGDEDLAQDPDSLGGKILRLDTASGRATVFSSGHRNVQGITFDDAGRLWATEFGQNRFDEVNQVSQGDNGGWPEVEGAGTGGGRFAAPEVVWEPEEASPSGAAVAGDDLYVAALRGRRLWRVPLDGQGGAGQPVPLLQGDYGRLRTVAVAPDGALWVTTSNRDGRGDPARTDDRVLRIPV